MARLLILRGEVADREVELKGKTVRLGRGPQNDVRLEDEGKSVSRNHAEIRYEGGRYVLVDLESQNGVWVAGKKVVRVVLEPDVVASVGPYRLMVESGSAAAAAYRPDAMTYAGPGLGPMTDSGSFAGPEPVTQNPTPVPAPAPRATAARAKTPAAPRPNWLNQQPKWVLGAAAAAVLAVVAITLVMVLRGGSPPVDPERVARLLAPAAPLIERGECAKAITDHINPALAIEPGNEEALKLKGMADVCAPPPVVPPPVAPTAPVLSAEEITSHIQEAGKLVDAGNCAAALETHINVVLISDPANADATRLKERAEICPPPSASPTGAKPDLARFVPPEKGGLALQPGELQKDYLARIQAMRTRYDEAMTAFSGGFFQRADMLFSAIVRDASDRYLDAGKLMLQSKDNLKQMALKLYATGRELEARDEWEKAIQDYRRAHEIHPEVVVELDIKRVNDKKTLAGEKKCAEGRANYAVRLNAVALQAYEEALRLLPTDHACYPEAKDRVALLKK